MLRDRPQTQSELEFVCIDELVTSDHLLRKVDHHIDFSFIHDLVQGLVLREQWSPNAGSDSMFKLLLVGYFLDILSDFTGLVVNQDLKDVGAQLFVQTTGLNMMRKLQPSLCSLSRTSI